MVACKASRKELRENVILSRIHKAAGWKRDEEGLSSHVHRRLDDRMLHFHLGYSLLFSCATLSSNLQRILRDAEHSQNNVSRCNAALAKPCVLHAYNTMY